MSVIRHATLVSCLGLLAFGGFASDARASSFALREESAEGLGNAFAGEAAKGDDASSAYYNPAGMARLNSNEIDGTVTWIQPDVVFHGSNSSVFGGNVSGVTGGNDVKPAAVGSTFAVWNASPDVKIGLAVAVPFGLRSEYTENWVGRYQALATDVTDYEISPTISYRVTSRLSIGGGPSIDYFSARLTQAINMQAIGLGAAQQEAAGAQRAAAGAQAAAAAGNTTQAAALSQQATQLGGLASTTAGLASNWGDGEGRLEGDDVGVGYTIGALYEIDDATRVGINYRSRIYHSMATNVTYQTPNTLALAGPLAANFASTAVTAKLPLPDSASLGFYHDIDSEWSVMSTVEWTDWSLFKQLNVVDSAGAAIVSLPQMSRDTWYFALGANYKPNEKWVLHMGTAYDQTPVQDQYRSPNLPDGDRVWASFGISYAVTPAAKLNLSYAHLFNTGKASVNYTSASPAAGTLVGYYDNSVNIASAGFGIKF